MNYGFFNNITSNHKLILCSILLYYLWKTYLLLTILYVFILRWPKDCWAFNALIIYLLLLHLFVLFIYLYCIYRREPCTCLRRMTCQRTGHRSLRMRTEAFPLTAVLTRRIIPAPLAFSEADPNRDKRTAREINTHSSRCCRSFIWATCSAVRAAALLLVPALRARVIVSARARREQHATVSRFNSCHVQTGADSDPRPTGRPPLQR